MYVCMYVSMYVVAIQMAESISAHAYIHTSHTYIYKTKNMSTHGPIYPSNVSVYVCMYVHTWSHLLFLALGSLDDAVCAAAAAATAAAAAAAAAAG